MICHVTRTEACDRNPQVINGAVAHHTEPRASSRWLKSGAPQRQNTGLREDVGFEYQQNGFE